MLVVFYTHIHFPVCRRKLLRRQTGAERKPVPIKYASSLSSLALGVICAWIPALFSRMPVASAQDTLVSPDANSIDSMDALSFAAPKEKGQIEPIPGRTGKALKFRFDNDCRSVMMVGRAAGTPAWDKAAGFSFWVKGDGSAHLGGLEFIYNGDYATRYAFAFSIDSMQWKKVVVRWSDLIPESSHIALSVDARRGNAPSRLGPVTFGKWWYWKDYAAHSYAIDDIRLEPVLPPAPRAYRPVGAPLARTLAKLKAGKPLHIVTMGDSLTDGDHWTNRQHNWPGLLQEMMKQKYGAQVTLLNPGDGRNGTAP